MEEARPACVGRAGLLLHHPMDGDEMAEVRLAGVLHLLDPLAEEEGRHWLVERVGHGGLRACSTPIRRSRVGGMRSGRGCETGPDDDPLVSLSSASCIRKRTASAAPGHPEIGFSRSMKAMP